VQLVKEQVSTRVRHTVRSANFENAYTDAHLHAALHPNAELVRQQDRHLSVPYQRACSLYAAPTMHLHYCEPSRRDAILSRIFHRFHCFHCFLVDIGSFDGVYHSDRKIFDEIGLDAIDPEALSAIRAASSRDKHQ
jgi:hypothetical protein